MIETKYIGLRLKSPVIVSSGPLTQSLDSLKKCEDAGAGAVVLKSIFEEQIDKDVDEERTANAEYIVNSSEEDFFLSSSRDYYINKYMKLLTEAKKSLSIPIIASVSAKDMDSWIDYSERFIACGADAIELNYYPISSRKEVPGAEVDKAAIEFARIARDRIKAPLSIKIGYKYSSLASMISSIDKIGVDGLVLFNRFFRPDIDIDKMEFKAGSFLSSPDEYGETLRWIGLLSDEVGIDLCGNTGIHSGETVVKMLLAGAKAVEVCSAIMKDGFETIEKMNAFIESWMMSHGYSSTDEFIGLLAEERRKDGYNWERTQFLKTID